MADRAVEYPDDVIPTLRYRYCPMCTAPLVQEVLFDDGMPRVCCPDCGWIQLASNVVAVAAVAVGEGGIAVIHPPGEAGIGLPAGLVEYGEHPGDAAVREVYEETGLEAEVVRCLGWFFYLTDRWPGPMVYFMYHVRVTGGELRGSDEGEAAVYPLEELPPITPHREGSRRTLEAYRASLDAAG